MRRLAVEACGMSPDENIPRPSPAAPITDSPWFWLVLFVAGALMAIVVIGPKHAYRQARLERMNDSREQIARNEAGELPEDDAPARELDARAARQFTLGPLAAVLALLLAVGAAALGVLAFLRADARRGARRRAKENP
jgi:hypothetical protein